jgi:hypothetical protein
MMATSYDSVVVIVLSTRVGLEVEAMFGDGGAVTEFPC